MSVKSCLLVIALFCHSAQAQWPPITREARPWTRWWWHGSSVTKSGLSAAMEQYQKAGLGGLELTPIYGVKGDEANFIPYLSDTWLEMLQHVGKEARRLDMGLDMALATGWPFGGPWVDKTNSARYHSFVIFFVKGGQQLEPSLFRTQLPVLRAVKRDLELDDLNENIAQQPDLQALALGQVRFEKRMTIEAVVAFSESGQALIVTDRVDQEGYLRWTAPSGDWYVCVLHSGLHGKLVERAAPGGEGLVIDHFSRQALTHHLQVFDRAFSRLDSLPIRAFFNDSYEVDDAQGEADFTPRFFQEFEQRRGYDLRLHLFTLYDVLNQEKRIRVLSDYGETISDLLLEDFTQPWQTWAHGKKTLTRNQAHGSPANILDLYAGSDIPETEGSEWLRIKFASSAAHVTGKKLVSAEAATWLGEHFTSTLADVKSALDLYFLHGVNHIFYHGTPFSPPDDPWPGRLFYASVHFGPSNSFWDDFGSLNRYVSRCQSFLQATTPDNDLLVYFPFYDLLAQPERSGFFHFSGGRDDYAATPFLECAEYLHKHGFSFDLISDRQVRRLQMKGQKISSGGQAYKAILVPGVRLLPVSTLAALRELARQGGQILFYSSLPEDVPGWGKLYENRQTLHRLLALYFEPVQNVSRAALGKGGFSISSSLGEMMALHNIHPEPMIESGVHFIRKKMGQDYVYVCVNKSGHDRKSWLPISVPCAQALLFDPMTGQSGAVPLRLGTSGVWEVYVELADGASCIIKTTDVVKPVAMLPRFVAVDAAIELPGPWTMSLASGGPAWPGHQIVSLGSWTDGLHPGMRDFSGTARYTLRFPRPAEHDIWQLDLGQVKESARIILNGQEIATCFSAPYRTIVELAEENTLEVLVSNLMANRIAALDRQKIVWKKFYNVNMPSRLVENRDGDGLFHADHWPARPSGLLGPVTVTPVQRSLGLPR